MSSATSGGVVARGAGPKRRGPNPETPIVANIRIALGMEPDLHLMRNHVGGSAEYNIEADEVRHQRFGLAKGSTDLVGILRRPMIDARTGQRVTVGTWFCLEVKTPVGRLSDDQKRWHRLARLFGAFVAIARNDNEARAALARARTGASE